MKAVWPEALSDEQLLALGATEANATMTEAKHELIRAVRAVRASYKISTTRPIDIVLKPVNADGADFLKKDELALKSLLGAGEFSIVPDYSGNGPCGVAVSGIATAYVPLAGIIDVEAELKKLAKQEDEIVKYLESVRKKLSNQNFVSHAPREVIEKEEQKIVEFEEKLARVREQIASFK